MPYFAQAGVNFHYSDTGTGLPVVFQRFCQTEEYRDLFRHWPYYAQALLSLLDDPRAEKTVIRLEQIANDAPCRSLDEPAAIEVPTHVLANRPDPAHPFAYGEILAGAIPGARLCEITAKPESESRHAADVQHCITSFLELTLGSPP